MRCLGGKGSFSLSRLPVCESKREGTRAHRARRRTRVPRSSSAAYGPETVRCDRLLVRAVVPCSGSLFLRGPVSVRRVSRFSLKSLRWRHIVERLIRVSLKDALVSPSDVQQVAKPCLPGAGWRESNRDPGSRRMERFVVPGRYGERRTRRRWWRRLSYTVQVSSWESPTVALTGPWVSTDRNNACSLFPYDCRASLALGSTFSRYSWKRRQKSPRWLNLVERARG